MRLSELNPKFLNGPDPDQPGQRGACVDLDCPCGQCGVRLTVPFNIALDGHPVPGRDGRGWDREGDTFETLTLKLSIQRIPHEREDGTVRGCAWHGFIEDGNVRPA